MARPNARIFLEFGQASYVMLKNKVIKKLHKINEMLERYVFGQVRGLNRVLIRGLVKLRRESRGDFNEEIGQTLAVLTMPSPMFSGSIVKTHKL